jgi:succinylglutamate desuccinylase
MFRSGVPLNVLQRYFGHRTQEMIEEDKHLSGTTEQTVEQEPQAMRLQMDALPQKFGLCDLHTHLSPCTHKTFTEYYTRLRTSYLSDEIIRLRDIYNASKQQKLPEEDDPQAQQQ